MGSFTSGLGSQLGVVAEANYAATGTPNRFFEFTSESLNLSRAFLMSQQLRAGRMFTNSTRRSATTRGADGAITMEVPSQQFGTFLNLFHGASVTPSNLSGSAYQQIHDIGTTDPYTKSITAQIGKPDTGGSVVPFTYPGTIATAVTFDCQTGGFLTANMTLDANDESTAASLTTASIPSGLNSFNFTQCSASVNNVQLTQCRGVSLTITTAKDVGRFYLGATTKAVPLTNAYYSATATITVDYQDNTLYNLFANASVVPVVFDWTGPVISGGNPERIRFTMNACGLDGDSPSVAGPGIVQQTIPLVVLDDGSNPPIRVTYQSSDSAL